MANKSAVLSVRIVTDAKAGVKGLDQYESRLKKFEGTAKKLAAPAAVVLGALTVAAKSAYDLAAAAEQNLGAVQTVFQGAADKVTEWSKTAADSVGVSASAYNELAARIGGSLATAGWAHDEMADKTRDLIDAAADLSSVFGGSAAEAAEALGAGLRGEFNSMERFGVFLNAAAVKAELAARGQDDLTGAAEDAAKKQAVVSLILEQAGKYAGNFAREADTAAGAQQRAAAAAEDAAAKLGEALIPVMIVASRALAGFAKLVEQNPGLIQVLVVALAALAAGVLAVNGAMMVYRAGATAAAAAQWILNAAMAANPLGLLAIAIGLIVVLVVTMYNKFEWFRDGVNGVIEWISGAFERAVDWIGNTWAAGMQALDDASGGAFGKILNGISEVIAMVRDALGWFSQLWQVMAGVPGAELPSMGAYYMRPAYDVPEDGRPFFITAAEPALPAAARFAGTGSGSGAGPARVVHEYHYDITVNGATDKLGTARELRKLLQELERAEGKKVGRFG